jgi:hypothetical protein
MRADPSRGSHSHAETVSPPATENANGKCWHRRSTRAPADAASIEYRASVLAPDRHCRRQFAHPPTSVVLRSRRRRVADNTCDPARRARGLESNAISSTKRSSKSSSRYSRSLAIYRRNSARHRRGIARQAGNDETANRTAPSISLSVADQYGGANASPVAALTARKIRQGCGRGESENRRAFQPYAEQSARMYAFASKCLRRVQCPKISPSPGGKGP